jgi:hypothetical protein
VVSGPYDKLGGGDYIPKAETLLKKITAEHGWTAVKTAEIREKVRQFSVLRVREADVYTLAGPATMYVHVPLAAKQYAREFQGKKWFSVSKTVIIESQGFGTNIVLTYIDELNDIRVSDASSATLDTKTGPYSRFNDIYFGWLLADTVPLGQWLDDPNSLKGQSKLTVTGNTP